MDAIRRVCIQGKQVDLGLVRDTDHWYWHNETQGDKNQCCNEETAWCNLPHGLHLIQPEALLSVTF